MAEKETANAKAAECYPVEQVKDRLQVPDAVHMGTCIQMGWSRGKEVTVKEYEAAVKKFKGTAAGRKKNA